MAMLLSTWMLWPHAACTQAAAPGSNPIIRDKFTADPAPLVVGDRLYLYVGHDQAQRDEMFDMREWLVYSTTDMTTWTEHGPIMTVADFKWAKADAWASQAIEKDGRFWFYAAVEHDASHPGKAIAVAVSDRPTGPFVDAKGSALITNAMTPKGTHSWEDIDPTVLTDDDGSTWIAWGNRQCYIARLKPNMIELDGPITEITPPHFEEGPRLHRRGDLYYLTYASLPSDASGRKSVLRHRALDPRAVDLSRRTDGLGQVQLHHPSRHRRIQAQLAPVPEQRRARHR
ncbi:family 43 glycosylhydrolase [Thermomonas carbonis]|uniref:family 43 glycosylhydrolase n=1 Tax=Thermomonas carbonis TaxID=1463158 RepID=UPI001992C313|nr:family 43 glycosylhydrolase [Thermomonas carbonis]GHB95506.1 hypothetical protein GCM10010080_03810 [Thermomonas carbonis]